VGNKAATAGTGVCASVQHSCAVFKDGTVSLVPRLVAGPGQHVATPCSATRAQNTNRQISRQVACVGGNAYGELGRGFASSSELDWAFVASIGDATHVQCGTGFTCVLHASGKVSCFGRATGVGNNGQADPQFTPFSTIPSGAVDLAFGLVHSCAIMEDASVKCWCGGRGPAFGGGRMRHGTLDALVAQAMVWSRSMPCDSAAACHRQLCALTLNPSCSNSFTPAPAHTQPGR
jgi:alpha-tubulin suppressor-like RCC1 family protein